MQPDDSGKIVELSLSDITGFIRKYFFFFLIVGGGAAVLGYLLSFLKPNEYTAYASILPEYSSGPGSSISELATLAGLGGRTRSEAVRPDLYPDILSSTPFLVSLLSAPLKNREGKTSTIFKLFQETVKSKDTLASPFTKEQMNGLDSSVLNITPVQRLFINSMRGRITVSHGKINGVIGISIELPDPVLAAAATRFTIDYLVKFVSDYRTGKENKKVDLLTEQARQAESAYRSAESRLASHRDRNRNIVTFTNRVDEQRLEGEYYRTQGVYNELMQRLQFSKVQREEVTPVLKVLEPPIVPVITSKPRRLVMAAGYAIAASFLALCYALFIKEKILQKLS